MNLARTVVSSFCGLVTAVTLVACSSNGGGESVGAGSAPQANVSVDDGSVASVQLTAGTARQNKAAQGAGDFFRGSRKDPAASRWVELSAGSVGELKPIVHDAADFTMYRFDKDSASPSKSNCVGDCAATWPPVLVQPRSKVFLNGVAKQVVGVVKRADGTLQITIGGWPVYRYSKDTAGGQANGQGIGGTWFAVSPTGAKVTGSASAPPSAPSTSTQTLGDGSVILDSGKNFTEPEGSEGVSGPGCQNVARPGQASSLRLTGGPIKLWTGRDCTGSSALVSDDVADLSTIGMDKKIVSIKFGN